MTEQRYVLHNRNAWQVCFDAFVSTRDAEQVYEVIIRPHEKTRTVPQNSRYWVALTELLKHLNAVVESVSKQTGYTPLEVKRLIAGNMPLEHVAILFARTPEVAHEVLKTICGIPTSTRLGTKEFSQFDEQMARVMAEIEGEVNAFQAEAA